MRTQCQSKTASSPGSDDYKALIDDLSAAIAPIQAIHQQAVESLAPRVREIIENRSRDTRLIEHTLDQLLDHACIPQGLAIFKTLCRYFWEIDPHATASYISTYREMWDFDDQKTKEAEIKAEMVNDLPHV